MYKIPKLMTMNTLNMNTEYSLLFLDYNTSNIVIIDFSCVYLPKSSYHQLVVVNKFQLNVVQVKFI